MAATGPLPSGFTSISQPASANETAGFRLAAPTNWTESTSGYQTYLKDPAEPNTNILIDLTPHAYPNDMLREARYIEARSISGFPGYHRLGLAAINIRGTSGSFWKFTWAKAGVQQEAIDLIFVAAYVRGPAVLRAVHDGAREHLRSDTADLRRRGGDLRHGAQLGCPAGGYHRIHRSANGRKSPMRKLTLIQKLPIKGENGRDRTANPGSPRTAAR